MSETSSGLGEGDRVWVEGSSVLKGMRLAGESEPGGLNSSVDALCFLDESIVLRDNKVCRNNYKYICRGDADLFGIRWTVFIS